MNNPTSKSSRLTRGVLGAALVLVLLPLLCPSASAQKAAVKTNIIHDATSTMNTGLEFKVAPRWTIDLSGDLNPWTFPGDRKFKHWLFQPEIRVWTCDAWAGHFFGLHALGGQFNVGGIDVDANFFGTDWSALKDRRYQGWMAGAGLGYVFNTDDSDSYLPIFIHTRFELPGVINSWITPFADAKSGVTIALDGCCDSGVFQSQTIGCRFAIGNGKCGISPGIGYTILPESSCVHLSVSFDF